MPKRPRTSGEPCHGGRFQSAGHPRGRYRFRWHTWATIFRSGFLLFFQGSITESSGAPGALGIGIRQHKDIHRIHNHWRRRSSPPGPVGCGLRYSSRRYSMHRRGELVVYDKSPIDLPLIAIGIGRRGHLVGHSRGWTGVITGTGDIGRGSRAYWCSLSIAAAISMRRRGNRHRIQPLQSM